MNCPAHPHPPPHPLTFSVQIGSAMSSFVFVLCNDTMGIEGGGGLPVCTCVLKSLYFPLVGFKKKNKDWCYDYKKYIYIFCWVDDIARFCSVQTVECFNTGLSESCERGRKKTVWRFLGICLTRFLFRFVFSLTIPFGLFLARPVCTDTETQVCGEASLVQSLTWHLTKFRVFTCQSNSR